MSVRTMNADLSRIELTRLGGGFSGRPDNGKYLRIGLIGLPPVLLAGLGVWLLLSGYVSKPAENENEPARGDTAVAAEPAPSLAAAEPAPAETIASEETVSVDGLKISSQSWSRGGLGSKALVTFTARNSNDYAVKGIAISCAFSRRDGSHLTDRTRVIHDINMRGRRTFARLHVGFVNVNASQAKCAPVAARRI